MACKVAGVQPPRLQTPYGIALLLGHIFAAQARITKKAPVISVSQVKIGNMGEHFDNTKAVSELGLPLTPIRTTVENTIAWFTENGYIRRRYTSN